MRLNPAMFHEKKGRLNKWFWKAHDSKSLKLKYLKDCRARIKILNCQKRRNQKSRKKVDPRNQLIK